MSFLINPFWSAVVAPAALRFYFPSTGAAEVTPAFGAGWDQTGAADRLKCVDVKIDSGNAEKTYTTLFSGGAPLFTLNRQYVSAPLEAGTISGTIKGQVKCRRATSQGTLAVKVFVVSNDGTSVIGTLVGPAASVQTTQPPRFEGGAATVNRRMLDSSDNASIPISTLAISAGDRLVIELGCRADVNGIVNGMVFGDQSVDPDLDEDDVDTSGNPWIEFSSCPPLQ